MPSQAGRSQSDMPHHSTWRDLLVLTSLVMFHLLSGKYDNTLVMSARQFIVVAVESDNSPLHLRQIYTGASEKKTSKIIFVITASNFHQI